MAVYEMLWDCPYCGTRKLLGKTHRFCPGCGAPQDPSRRYFPAEADKVAAEDHVYVGADRLCGACGSAMSARAQHCTQCGSPMEGAGEVARVADEAGGGAPDAGAASGPEPGASGAAAPPSAAATLLGSHPPAGTGAKGVTAAPSRAAVSRGGAQPPGGARRSRGCCLGLGLAVAGLVALAVALLWTRSATATVTGHSWQRSIAIERLAAVQESGWCDALPKGAYQVSRSRKQRDTRRVADGEDCTTLRVDQGDGTFREDEQCTPRFRDEAVYADHCRYTVDRWSVARTAQASGESLDPGPRWPGVQLARSGSCRGCEREGAREQKYVVRLRTDDGQNGECALAEDRWRAMPEGSRWRVKQGALLKGVRCGDLQPAR